ncbi:ABC transporter permease [Candidatus Latescibacterota bacterium]
MFEHLIKLIVQSFNDMKKQKLRCLLTMSGITWGTMSVILLLSFGNSLKVTSIKNMSGLGSNIVVIGGKMTTKPYKGMPPGRWVKLRPESTYLLKKQIPEIDKISPEIQRYLTLSIGTERQRNNCVGVYPVYGELRNLVARKGGRFINPYDEKYRRRVVFLGTDVSERFFGKDTNPVGKMMMLQGIPYTVIGVMKEKVQNSSYMFHDKGIVFIPFSTCREMLGVTYINRIICRARTSVETPLMKEKTYQVLSGKFGFSPEDKDALSMWDTSEATQFMHYFFLGFEVFLFLGGVLTLVVGGIGVANIMYVSIRERRREIGIKTALGATPKLILFQFLLESFIIMLVGGSIGVIGAWIIVTLFGQDVLSKVHIVMGIPTIDLNTSLITASILTLIGFAAGWSPARRAAEMDPVQALEV